MSHTPNPLEKSHATPPPTISSKQFVIAGILTTVYGLDELEADRKHVSCLWLLHPRLATQAYMAPLASTIISHWNGALKESKETRRSRPGLIAVSFDQRNHGTREVDASANKAWREGGERHAQDMFSTYHGTALDCSQLITYLSAYVFPEGNHHLLSDAHLALGVSLGGHCVWHCLLQDARITTGVVVIGCPDYVSLMTDRARLSKRRTWTGTSPQGSQFLGSVDFPPGLVHAVEKYDPAGLFLGGTPESSYTRVPTSEEERRRIVALMDKTLKGKRILNLAGGADKLVPYARGEAFLAWLKKTIGPGGCYSDGGVVLEDRVFEGVGHAMSPAMVDEATRFICQSLELWEPASDRASKI